MNSYCINYLLCLLSAHNSFHPQAFMQYMSDIPTQKLYQAVSLEAYQHEQQTYIKRIFGDAYHDKSDKDKWCIIMDAFSSAAPHKAETLQRFCRSRNDSHDNENNLALDQCIDYFEHFYFLYTTDNPDFQLTDSQKTRLVELIEEAIGTCETGKNMRFHQALQEFSRDGDWVLNELTQHRYQILLRMHDAYNAEHGVPAIMGVHTLNALLRIADEADLGIPQAQEVRDVYLDPSSYTQIKAYFDAHYQAFFSEYEQNAIENLTLHLLLEFKDKHDLFAEAGFDDWYNPKSGSEFHIPYDKVTLFREFITSRFALPEGEINLLEVGEFSEDYTYFQLNEKNAFKQVLQKWVAKKLMQEGYLLSIASLKPEDKAHVRDPDLQKNWDSMVKLSQALQTPETSFDSLNLLLKEHASFIAQHPGVLLNGIQRHPKIILCLPSTLKANPCFIEPVLECLDQLLLETIDLDDSLAFKENRDALLSLVQYESQYTQHLSARVLNHPDIAEKLLEKDGLMLRRLSDESRDHEDIVEAAIRQNPYALFYASVRLKNHTDFLKIVGSKLKLERDEAIENFAHYCKALERHYKQKRALLPAEIQHHCDVLSYPGTADTQNDIAIMQRIDAVHTLLNPEVSIRDVMQSTKAISPALLLKIVHYRQSNSLKPLPFSLKPSAIERFIRELESHPTYRAHDDWHTIRKNHIERYGINRDADKSPMDFIVQTNHWFIAMVRYETSVSGRFNSWGKVIGLTKDFLKALLFLCSSVAKILAIIALAAYLTTIPFYLLPLFVVQIIFYPVTAAIAYITANMARSIITMFIREMLPFLDNGSAAIASVALSIAVSMTVINILGPFLLIPAPFIYAAQQYIIADAKNAFTQLVNMYDAITTLFARSFSTLFNLDVYAVPEKNDSSLSEKCAHGVYRLQTMEDVSAQEKGEILESLLTEIEQKTRCDEGIPDESLSEQLHKPRDFSHQGQSHRLSFFEVASTRRGNCEQFRVQEGRQSHSFFSSRTTTVQIIDCERPDELAEPSLVTA